MASRPPSMAAAARSSTSVTFDGTSLPRELHNFFAFGISCLILAWTALIVMRLMRLIDVKTRLSRMQALHLEGMSVYAEDFQLLIRQHFNQILRIRRTVPPRAINRYAMSVHLHPDSIGISLGEIGPAADATAGAVAGNGAVAFGVKFSADAASSCSVRLYWGVTASACNDFVQKCFHAESDAFTRPTRTSIGGRGQGRGGRGGWPRSGAVPQEAQRSLLETEADDINHIPLARRGPSDDHRGGGVGSFQIGQYVAQSRDFFLPAGLSQRYATPAGDLMHPSQLPFDLTAPWLQEGHSLEDGNGIMPLVIVSIAQPRPPHELGEVQGHAVVEMNGQASFVKFRRMDETTGMPMVPEVVKQISFCVGAAYEIQGVFGFEGEGEDDCMICYSRPKNVILLPCRHCSVCHPCLRSLRDEKCPLCRSSFSSYATLPINRTTSRAQTSPAIPVATAAANGGGLASTGGVASAEDVSGSAASDGAGSVGVAPSGDRRVGPPAKMPPPLLSPRDLSLPTPVQPSSVTLEMAITANTGLENDTAAAPMAPTLRSGSQMPAQSTWTPQCGATSAVRAAATTTPIAWQHPVSAETAPRQARDVQLGRPRGVAPAARSAARAPRASGRARFGAGGGSFDSHATIASAGGNATDADTSDAASCETQSLREPEPTAAAASDAHQEGRPDETHSLIADA